LNLSNLAKTNSSSLVKNPSEKIFVSGQTDDSNPKTLALHQSA